MKKDNNKKTDGFEDLNSFSSKRSDGYEDISSDSRRRRGGAHARPKTKKKKKFAAWWAKRKKGEKITFVTSISVIALCLLLFIVWGLSYIIPILNYNHVEITSKPEDLGIEEVIDEKIINVALFGIDSRNTKSFKGNSDSIMILSLNTKTKKVKIISVMRDTLVPIEHKGKTTYSKINSAYQKGGPELAIKTLNKVFKLDISEYATVNFFGMKDIIDAVGGIEAELTKAEITRDYGINSMIGEQCEILKLDADDYYVRETGKQHLNGLQAVAYARIRYVPNIWGTNNDYGRTDRQRYVMEQLFNKATQMSKTQYIKLAKALVPCSETSLSYSDIIDLAVGILLKSPTFEQFRIPQEDFLMPSPKGSFGSVVYYDLDFASDIIHSIIYDDITVEQYVEANGIQKNDWYKGGSSGGSSKPSSSTGGSSSGGGSKPSSSSDDEDDTSSDSSSNVSSDTSSDDETDTSSGDNNSSDNNSSNNSSNTSNNSSDNSSNDTSSEGNPDSSDNTTQEPTESGDGGE